MENKNLLVGILIVLALLCVVFNSQISSLFSPQKETQKQQVTVSETEQNNNIRFFPPKQIHGIQEILVNQPIGLSGKSKDEIYNIRKKYVSQSIFAAPDYEPSDEVFGGIESGKPWIENNICKEPDNSSAMRHNKASEETRFINNPALLVAIEYPFSFSDYPNEEWCADPENNLIPDSIQYDGDKKEITVYYTMLPFKIHDNFSFYQFNGINARDLGYNYAYVDKGKSTFNVKFTDSNNMGNSVISFQNYIHLGSSCGVSGGCNNGSPRQSFLEFRYEEDDYSDEYDGTIYIKLWKSQPASYTDTADITEKIIIREY